MPQRLLARAHELAAIGTYMVDPETRTFHLSVEMASLLRAGSGAMALSLESFRDRFVHPDDRLASGTAADRAYAAGLPFRNECRMIRGDGEVIHVRASSSVEDDEQGNPIIVGVVQDVTEERRAQKELRASETRFRVLADTSLTGIYILDEDRIVYANPTMEQIFGYAPGEMTGLLPQRIVHPDDLAELAERIRRRLAGEQRSVWHEFRGVCNDGTIVTLQAIASRAELDGRLVVIGNLLDITASKQAEAARVASEARLRMLIETAPVAIRVSRGLETVYVNQAFVSMYGLDSADAIAGRSDGELWAPECRDEVLRWLRQRSDGQSVPSSFEAVALRPDGRRLAVHADVKLLDLPEGRTVVTFLDESRPADFARRIFDLARIARYVIDLDSRVVHFSAELARLLAVGTDPFDLHLDEYRRRFYRAEDLAEVARNAERAYATREPFEREVQLVRTDGVIIWVRITSVAERNDRGAPVVHGIVQDITERKLARLRAVEQTRQLETLTDRMQLAATAAGIGVWEWDIAERRLVCDDIMHRQFGIDAKDVDGTFARWKSTIDPDDADRVLAGVQATLRGERDIDHTFRLRRPDGSRAIVQGAARLTRDAAGNPARMVGVSVDITQQRVAEERLRESEARFRALADSSRVGIFVLQDGRYSYVNPAMAALFGYSVAQMNGMTPGEIVQPSEGAMSGEHSRRRIDDELRGMQYEVRGRCRDGTTRDVEVFDSQVEIDGRPALVGTLIDISERKRAEERLRASEARFRSYFASPEIGVAICDDQQRFIEVNDRICELLGYSREEMLQLGLTDHPLPGDPSTAFEDMMRGEVDHYTLDKPLLRKDGSEMWAIVSVRAVRKEDRSLDFACATVQDITARRLAERRIEHLNRLYVTLTEVNELIVRQRDRQILLEQACQIAVEKGRFCMASIGMLDAQGQLTPVAAAGAVNGFLAHLTLGPDDVRRAVRPSGQCITTGAHVICRDIASDPDLAPWRDEALRHGFRAAAAFPLRIGARVVGTFALFSGELDAFGPDEVALLDELALDISFALEVDEHESQRRRMEGALSESERRFVQIAESIDQVFWMVDPLRQQSLYISPGFAKVWGRPVEWAMASSRNWAAAIHPQDRERVEVAAQTKSARGEYDETYRILRPDGTLRWIHDRSFPVKDASGALVSIAGTATDITAQHQLEEQLRQSQKMEAIGVLAGGVAHDFNNLLAVILSYTELSMADLPELDPMLADLKEIHDAAERAVGLTRQLLAFSRQQMFQPVVADLNEILAGSERMLRRMIGEDVELETVPSAAAVRVFVDPGQIEQVVMNLAVNARDAMPEGGRLRLETSPVVLHPAEAALRGLPAGPYVTLSVIDTGDGMDAATSARIFEPFFTTKAVGKGTGLGLSTVFGIVKQSGGHIDVDSEPGRGTRFHIWLPFAAGATAGTAIAPGAPELRGAGTILLVEDDDALRRVARTILVKGGYRVLEARSGGDAVVLAERHKGEIDLLLTDMVMPLMSGEQVAARLRAMKPDLRVVFMSGYPDKGEVRRIHVSPAQFVQKPFTPDSLLQRIRSAMGG